MPKFQLKPHQIRALMVTVLLSFIVASPVLSQPLGLSSAWNQPTVEAGNTAVQNTDVASGTIIYPNYTLDSFDADLMGRSLPDETEYPDETAASETAAPTETTAPTETVAPTESIAPIETTAPAETAAPTEPVPTASAFKTVYYVIYVSSDTLNLRAGPSTDDAILSKLTFGDKLQCVGTGADWLKVEFGEYLGYVKAEYTINTVPYKAVNQTVYVSSSTLNLREGPSTDYNVITALSNMTKLTRTGIGKEWSIVKTSKGTVGYVLSQYLTTTGPVVKPAPTAAAATTSNGTTSTSAPASSGGSTVSGSGSSAVDFAYQALGTPYVSCGSSLSGMDCSGFVSWVYRQMGIDLPRSSTAYGNVGSAVSYADMQPGDIICIDHRAYDGKTSITHVAIYVGNDTMIHASSSNRKVVTRSVSNYMDWNRKYQIVTIRRIVS